MNENEEGTEKWSYPKCAKAHKLQDCENPTPEEKSDFSKERWERIKAKEKTILKVK